MHTDRMASMKIQVTACDIDREVPAQTYTIQSGDGRSVTRDLCELHAEPFEALLAEAEVEEPVRKPAAKKATGPRKRPRVTSLAEIEASKKR